jgi:hypothetical protein
LPQSSVIPRCHGKDESRLRRNPLPQLDTNEFAQALFELARIGYRSAARIVNGYTLLVLKDECVDAMNISTSDHVTRNGYKLFVNEDHPSLLSKQATVL